MLGTEAKLFDSPELAVGKRQHPASPGTEHVELPAAGFARLVPGLEREPWNGSEPSRQFGRGLPALLLEDVEDRDRALFLSRSYVSKILSTVAGKIAIPTRWQRPTICALDAWGLLMNSSKVAMTWRLVGRGLRFSSMKVIRRRNWLRRAACFMLT